ncbi:MAG TPA: hypothetical protein DCM86_14895 [Verrucomicrobiales bacterium]|nr:hypothetical protein [Verrucomicrobiales bacterium]
MGVIFAASSDAGSSQHSSRIIGPIVRWLYPQIAQAEMDRVVFGVRKAAHVTEYAILAMLLWRAFRARAGSLRPPPHVWWSAWGTAAAYAATDEIHQTFVPTRTGQWQDVVIDSTGALLGLLALWIVTRRGGKGRDPKGGVKRDPGSAG